MIQVIMKKGMPMARISATMMDIIHDFFLIRRIANERRNIKRMIMSNPLNNSSKPFSALLAEANKGLNKKVVRIDFFNVFTTMLK